MKVALLRCHGLRKYEMQGFEPLKGVIEIKAFSPWKHEFDLAEISLPVERIPPPSKLSQVLRDLQNLAHGRKGNLFRKADFFLPQFEKSLRYYDIIHVGEISSKSSYVGARLKEKYGMKLVATVWENIPFFDVGDDLKKFIYDLACRRIDLFIVPTERGKEVLKLEGIPEEKIKVIYPGIEIERFSPQPPDTHLQKALGLSKEDKIILFAGRMVYKKGIYTLVQAIKEIKRTNPGIPLKVIMLGKGPEEEKLKNYIRILGLEKDFIIYGHVPYEKIPLFYNLSHLFVLPSIPTDSSQEQFGFVLAEAMAAGKAIITTFTGSIPEVVDDAAILVPPDDYLALARTIASLFADEKKRIGLGEKARTMALAKYDSRDTARKMLKAYESILSLS